MSEALAAELYTLPILRLTTVSERPGPEFLPVNHRHAGQDVKYWRKRSSGKAARWQTFLKFPLVLNADGSPWEPACLWLLDRAKARPLRMSSLPSVAHGLKDYRRFLDDLSLDWKDFSDVEKYNRPTYLYKTHLQGLINSGQIMDTTAKRRMSAVIGLYRFLRDHSFMRFEPVNEPWVETRLGFEYRDREGRRQVKEVASTDVSIRASKKDHTGDGTLISREKDEIGTLRMNFHALTKRINGFTRPPNAASTFATYALCESGLIRIQPSSPSAIS